MADVGDYLGQQINIKGFAGLETMSGDRRHPKDTDDALCLTLYDQEGTLQELVVKRSRDMELFQEWLRRYDRYTPREKIDA